MRKELLIIGIGVAAYFFYKKSQASKTTLPLSYPSQYQPAQPSQVYPFQPIRPPRVDNANQPWYNGSQGFQGGSVNQVQSLATTLQAGSSVVHSVADIWGNLGKMFGGTNDPKSNLASVDSLPSAPMASNNLQLQTVDQSNYVGDQMGDNFGYTNDVSGLA